MPYPVPPPPQLPAIVQTVPPALTSVQADSDELRTQPNPDLVSSSSSDSSESLATTALATPPSPERFNPPPVPGTVAQTANLLGNPITIEDSVQPETEPVSEVDDPLVSLVKEAVLDTETATEPEKPTETLDPNSSNDSTVTPVETSEPNGIEIPVDPPVKQPESPAPTPVTPQLEGVIELTADRQEFDEQRQIFTAEGNVLMRFRNAVLRADRLQVNLNNRIAVANGNVALTQGQQVFLGDRFLYNFVQGTGEVQQARGVIFVPTANTDFALASEENTAIPRLSVSDRFFANQPPRKVSSSGGGINITGGTSGIPQLQGTISRVRFEADNLRFYPEGWQAQKVRLTNDPFSPPELEVRAEQATFTRVSPLRDELRTTKPRLVFDQWLKVPILRNTFVFDRTERDPALVTFGFDSDKRGGLFVERSFEVISTPRVQWKVTPQFLIQRAISTGWGTQDFGLKSSLQAFLTPSTILRSNVNIAGFDDLDDKGRYSARLTQLIPTPIGVHTLTGEYSHRDRLYNGSLGYQTVQRSIGAVLASPIIPLGTTGVNLNYQVGYQSITAKTDDLDLLDFGEFEGITTLGRFQASASLGYNFFLWKGKALPATLTEGLRYTPIPVVPYIQAITRVTGTTNQYSNGDHQNALSGTIGLRAQFGHFSRPWFDYTGVGIIFSKFLRDSLSPFRFDRLADATVLTGEFSQQLYGPIRFGVRSSVNLDTGKYLSTEYSLEYSRRTYGLSLRYNATLGIAAFVLRISDFNWVGGTQPFGGSEVRPVQGGVVD